jgi:hypothetical protein
MPQFRQEHLEFATAGLVGKLLCVITVKEIEAEIEKLPTEELLKLAKWIDERVGQEWDREFEEDVACGKLDRLGKKAIVEYRAGKTRPFPE